MNAFCKCGCGRKTSISKINRYDRGNIKGQPVEYVKGHNPRRSLLERFWEKIDKNGPMTLDTPCWIWTGAKTEHGYGITWEGGKTIRATHIAFFIENGKKPKCDMCHQCDNPPCVRYSHLFEGTAKDNSLDALAKGRLKQWNKGKSKISLKERRDIIKEYSEGLLSIRQLGVKHCLAHSTVSKIIRMQSI